MKVDLKLVFDGVPDGKGLKSAFTQAIKLVKSGKYKTNNKDRANMLNMRLFSDFLSGGSGGRSFGTPAFDGFYGEPKNLRGYVSKDSAPDVELEYEDLVRIFGKETAASFTFDDDATSSSRRTIEIKQKQGSGSSTTFTQLGADKGFEAEIASLRGQSVVKTRTDSKGQEKVKASLYDQEVLFNWFESPKQAKFRARLIKQFEQKMQNYLLFAKIDGKQQITAVPGLAKIFNLNQGAARRRKLLRLEYTGGATGGSVALRASPSGDKLIKDSTINVTTKMLSAVNDRFLENLLRFYVSGAGQKILKKTGALTKYGFVNAFAEILLLAQEFDPQFGGKPLEIKFEGLEPSTSGSITAKTIIGAVQAPKAKKQSVVQQAVSEIQLEEIARRAFVGRMPKDKGQPPVPGILTYRTGRFAESFQITKINEAAKIITYTYDPVYRIHETTGRDPKRLIGTGIRDAVRQVLKTNENYRLVRR
jgi:hypothetical protein